MTGKKIVIAEDHTILREGLRSLLSEEFEVVAEAKDGLDAIQCVERCRPDLILLDLSMPKMSGIELLKELRADRDQRAFSRDKNSGFDHSRLRGTHPGSLSIWSGWLLPERCEPQRAADCFEERSFRKVLSEPRDLRESSGRLSQAKRDQPVQHLMGRTHST